MERLLLASEGAAILRVTIPRFYQLVRDGVVPAIRVGRQIRVDPQKLQDWLDRGGRSLAGGWKHDAA